ncbi:hypothetical protein [Rhizorhapis sp. SPR117]|uniref:hypothetical protein n=1 Tax=Rhizorhapis sp. SPR117 TaxID=2912611 RepID=UPI001F27FA86|nr:hypothetical protein [Rhizorhapis sp. SPR117]
MRARFARGGGRIGAAICFGMTERSRRDAPISYRPPEALREEFHARVARSGLSLNAFITQSVFADDAPRQARRAPVEQQEIARLLAETARLHDRLHDCLGAVGVDGLDAALLADAMRDLRDIRAACLSALGRKP